MPFGAFGGIQDFTWSSAGDSTPPTVSSLTVNAAGNLEVACNEPLNASSGDEADFHLDAPVNVTFTGISIFGNTATLTPTRPLFVGETVTLDYTPGGTPITDVAGNALGSFSNQAVTNSSAVVVETVVDQWEAAGTLTAHAAGRSITWRTWGSGGGADGDNNTGQSGTGGGAGCAVKSQATAEPSYTVTFGAPGVSGVLGVGTADGADCVVSGSISGELSRAKGGLKGVAGNPSGTGGAGGSGGTGDTTTNGGSGSATPNAATGGSSGGSTTSASGATPGNPDGAFSVGTNASSGSEFPGTGGNIVAGGTLTNTAAPGACKIIWIYEQAATSGYPYLDQMSQGRDTANATSRTIVVPGTHVADDRLLFVSAVNGPGGVTSMTGTGSDWVEFVDAANGGNHCALFVAGIDSTGTEDTTLATNLRQTNWLCRRIKNAAPVSTWEVASAQVNSLTTINLPSLTYSGGSKPILWVATFSALEGQAHVTAWPSGFEQRFQNPARDNSANGAVAVCYQKVTGASSPTGSFTVGAAAGARGLVALIAIPLLGS